MRNISKILVIFASILLLSGCSVRKKITEKERIRIERDTILIHDSIYITKDKIILLPSVNTEIIQNPCDEYGKLKPILENIKFPYGTVNINSENGSLKVKVNTDSINSVYQNQYRERNDKQVQKITDLQKEITQLNNVTCSYMWKPIGIISICVNILLGIILSIIVIKNKLVKWI